MKQTYEKRPHRSIADRIRTAEDEAEIERLMAEGAQFEDATDSTQARWQKQAKKRRKELGS